MRNKTKTTPAPVELPEMVDVKFPDGVVMTGRIAGKNTTFPSIYVMIHGAAVRACEIHRDALARIVAGGRPVIL